MTESTEGRRQGQADSAPALAGRTGAAPFVTDQPPQQLVDGDIRQRLAAGQYHEAFERLVERYSVKVFHLACSRKGSEYQIKRKRIV